MARFNFLKRDKQRTVNRAGGEAFTQDARQELAALLLTSFAQDQFYRRAEETFDELAALLLRVDPLFAAKAAVYARHEFGMRSITHVLTAELAVHVSGRPWAKAFYERVVRRPDDMTETLAYFYSQGGKALPNAVKRGFARAFDRFDGYQLAKYRGERRAVKLVDVVNLVHPVPSKRNAEALQALVDGTLRSRDTWEARLTKAGQEAVSEADKAEQKAEAWAELIDTGKLGYFALLRNLRNIGEQAPALLDLVCELLVDRARIRGSLVLPFRFLTAMEAVRQANLPQERRLLRALSKALDLSLDNVPRFDGCTLVVLDESGSMTWGAVRGLKKRPIDIGAVFAAVLYKSNEADLMTFSNEARYADFYFGDATMSLAERLIERAVSGGTNFHAIFERAKRPYDRIVILSDMQGWVGGHAPTKAFEAYKRRTGADPFVYSFDLQGYGSLQLPERNVFCLAGFSDKVFDVMQVLEQDRQALITAIEAVKI